jgi:hypothetical protein
MGKNFGIPQKECLKFRVGLECIAKIVGEPEKIRNYMIPLL